jgi:hypothetical protein
MTSPHPDTLTTAVGWDFRIVLGPVPGDRYGILVETFDVNTGRRVDWAITTRDAGAVAGQVASMAAFHEETPERIGLGPIPASVELPTDVELDNALAGLIALGAVPAERF